MLFMNFSFVVLNYFFCAIRYGIAVGNYCEFVGSQEKIKLGYEYKVSSFHFLFFLTVLFLYNNELFKQKAFLAG